MKIRKRTNYLLIAIIFGLGLVLRFYLLGSVPVSMHRDEAFLGYNAYSILKTGKDISGSFLPLHIESFFFSPAGYSYFSIPFILLFGLNEFSVRFASALFGTLTIALVYLISLELFKENNNKNIIALFSSFFLAVMPWHVNLSRVAVENTVVVFFISLGVYLYLRYLNGKRSILLFLSFLSFGINFFIYQAPRAFVPLFIPFLGLNFQSVKTLIGKRLQIVLYFVLIVTPVIFILLSPNLSWRIQSLNIFHNPETKLVIREQLVNDTLFGLPIFASRAFHNKISGYSLLFLDNYFSHISYGFLFSDGGLPTRFKIPNMGLLYIYQLPLLALSFIYLYIKNRKINLFLFGWIGISFFGSALTYDDIPNFQRTLIASPPFAILSGYGLYELITRIRNSRSFWLFTTFITLIIVSSLFYFAVQYFVQGKVYQTWDRQDGYKKLVSATDKLLPDFKKAEITTRETAPSILFLFYSKYAPVKFQEETTGTNMKESDHVDFGSYDFSEEECPLRLDPKTFNISGKKDTLYVNSSLCKKEVPGGEILETIRRVDGSEVFYIMKVK